MSKLPIMVKLLLWLTRKHKWHKDWFGCWICEIRLKNNPDKPRINYEQNEGSSNQNI